MPARKHRINRMLTFGLGCALIGSVAAIPVSSVVAGPRPESSQVFAAQGVDWLSSESASALNLGFPVLAPGWVPAPFFGEPSISTSGGYYSLYWMNVADDPTFLQITGQVGGSLPAGSPYDLNNQLFVNASVNGYEAIHDVTPIYDQVWWIADGVLYNINSKNLADTDSLSLANSLSVIEAGSGGGESPTEPPVVDQNANASFAMSGAASSGDSVSVSVTDSVNVNLTADGGVFAETGDVGVYNINSGSFTWQAPNVGETTTYTLYLSDANTGGTLWSAQVVVNPAAESSAPTTVAPTTAPDVEPSVEPTSLPTEPTAAASNEQRANPTEVSTEVPTEVSTEASTDGSTEVPAADAPTKSVEPTVTPTSVSSPVVLSDGTDGPPRPIVGSDGTGGIQVVDVPGNVGRQP